jgi:polysaccharide export outer membrane protein
MAMNNTLGANAISGSAHTGRLAVMAIMAIGLVLSGCATTHEPLGEAGELLDYEYVIGPGDSINIFVWNNPEVSTTVPVRPDGVVSAPLVDEVFASGKTPTQLARDLEKSLSEYIKDPLVTVMVGGFTGRFDQQIRIVGEANAPAAIPFRQDMSLLDTIIAVGGLTEFAAGNRAVIIRNVDGKPVTGGVRIDDLLQDGDISANVAMRPGDILIIPEAWF